MIDQPLLTVIVPCYNVEKYIDKCISSVVNQIYANLEILLIDDGSPDNCGLICDSWQERDSRIRVIHKQNEGLAYARKTGIENATAEYVTFVDADDWIDINMYTNMMTALLSTGSDIAQCGVCIVYEDDGRMVHRDNKKKIDAFDVVERVESVLLILEDKRWRSWMWCKIFKKYLFNNIQFLKGNGFAEDFISHELFHRANQSVYLYNEYYFYLQRGDSITKSKSIPAEMKNQHDYYEAYYYRYAFTSQHPEYHSALPYVKNMTICVCMNFLRNMIENLQFFPNEYFYTIAEQLRSIRLTRGEISRCSIKINLFVLKISPKLYYILKSFYLHTLHVTNKLKITNRPTTRSLVDFFGWV